MSIFVDENTKVVYQGLTGSQGRFYGLRNRDYGTQVVAGTNPKKAGTDVEGIPIFAIVAEAVAATGATASCIFIPAPGVKGAVMEAAEGGIEFVVVHHRGRAGPGRGLVLQQAPARLPAGAAARARTAPASSAPASATSASPPARSPSRAGRSGIVSRSGTLTYQALYELKLQDIGVTTCVGIGGDPVPGTTFIDCLERFEADPDTQAVMMIGEIGGSAEEEAAEFIATKMTKPVSAYIAGVTAPAGKKMGHAGAIVSGGKGTAAAKMEALEAAGVKVGPQPDRGRQPDGRDRPRPGLNPPGGPVPVVGDPVPYPRPWFHRRGGGRSMPVLLGTIAQSSSSTSSSASTGVAVGLVLVSVLVYLAFVVLIIAGMWKVFEKAGQKGWLAIIPIVNLFVLIRLAGREGWWIILFLIPCISIVVGFLVYVDLARRFDKSAAYGVGLLLVPVVFFPMLGFGSAQYQGDRTPVL